VEQQERNHTSIEPASLPAKTESRTERWLIGCAALFFLFVVSLVVTAVYYISKIDSSVFPDLMEASGIKMQNELSNEAADFLKKKKLLKPDEKLITYYDLWMDRTKVCILTDRRVIYYYHGNVSSMPLDLITEVKRYKRRDLDGNMDVFILESRDGQHMKVEMAEWDGPDVFERELNDAMNAAKKSSSH
jgi:hypothetical protein